MLLCLRSPAKGRRAAIGTQGRGNVARPQPGPPEPAPGAPAATAAQGDERALLRFGDPLDDAGVTCLPNIVLEDTRLSALNRLAYGLLLRHATEGSDEELVTTVLASELGVSVREARGCLKALVDAGLLRIETRRSDGVPTAFAIEPLATRYGPGAQSAGGRTQERVPVRERPAPAELRGAIIPIMTEQRRAYEERLAAKIPPRAAPRVIDPTLRELGLTRARELRAKLATAPKP